MTEDEDYQTWYEQNMHDAAEAFAALNNEGWTRAEYDEFLDDWDIADGDEGAFWDLYDSMAG